MVPVFKNVGGSFGSTQAMALDISKAFYRV